MEEGEGEEDTNNDEKVDRLEFLELTQRYLGSVQDQREQLIQAVQRG